MKRTWLLKGVYAAAFLLFCVTIYRVSAWNMIRTSAVLSDAPITVIIDPGHGGEDGGAISLSGIAESNLNLAISKKLDQVLRLCGFRTYLIRTEDKAVYTGDCPTIADKKVSDLKNRVAAVNAIHPAVLLSVHQNHFSDQKYDGAQVFYAGSTGSMELAQLTQTALRNALDPQNHREIKQAQSVYLMEHILCPGVLVECGFLSNPREEQLLQDEMYQKKIACAIAGGLSQFLQERDMYGEV